MVVANPPISGRTRVCGAPPPEWGVGGWIVGFHYWTSEGKPYGRRVSNDQNDVHTLTLDNVRYPVNSLKGFPVGFAKAPIVLAGVGNCSVLAGNVGKKVSKGMPPGYMEAAREADITLPSVAEEDHSMLQPGSAWMLYGPFSSGQPKSSHTQQTDPIVQSALNRNLGQGQCPKPPALQPFSRRK
jgi:hypothetical protein